MGWIVFICYIQLLNHFLYLYWIMSNWDFLKANQYYRSDILKPIIVSISHVLHSERNIYIHLKTALFLVFKFYQPFWKKNVADIMLYSVLCKYVPIFICTYNWVIVDTYFCAVKWLNFSFHYYEWYFFVVLQNMEVNQWPYQLKNILFIFRNSDRAIYCKNLFLLWSLFIIFSSE